MLKLMQDPLSDASPLLEAEWDRIARQLELSPRELQIVRLVTVDAKEHTIARRLGISIHTVHSHLKRIYAKSCVSSRVELILEIFREYVAYAREGNALRETIGSHPTRKAA